MGYRNHFNIDLCSRGTPFIVKVMKCGSNHLDSDLFYFACVNGVNKTSVHYKPVFVIKL